MDKKSMERALRQGAKAKVVPKVVEVNGLQDVMNAIAEMTERQIQSNQELQNAMIAVVAAIQEKDFNGGTDMGPVERAVNSLQALIKSQEPSVMDAQCDYVLEGERDQRGLIKFPLTFKAVPRVLN